MNTLIVAAIRCFLMFLVPGVAYAVSAQWDLDPISGDWNTAANWTPMGIPNGPADIATFGLSNTTNVSISANTEVNSIVFTPAATNPYAITAGPGLTLAISGVGITNNSGRTQVFGTVDDSPGNFGTIAFSKSATAGSNISIFNEGGSINFFNRSSAGSASIEQPATRSPRQQQRLLLAVRSSTFVCGSLPFRSLRRHNGKGATWFCLFVRST